MQKTKIMISMILFLSVSDYSLPSLDILLFKGQGSSVRVLRYNEMANIYDWISSCRILLFIYLRTNLSCPSF